jgi:hypothetical protein
LLRPMSATAHCRPPNCRGCSPTCTAPCSLAIAPEPSVLAQVPLQHRVCLAVDERDQAVGGDGVPDLRTRRLHPRSTQRSGRHGLGRAGSESSSVMANRVRRRPSNGSLLARAGSSLSPTWEACDPSSRTRDRRWSGCRRNDRTARASANFGDGLTLPMRNRESVQAHTCTVAVAAARKPVDALFSAECKPGAKPMSGSRATSTC